MQNRGNLITDGLTISREISPNDRMLARNEGHYFSVGLSALDCISDSLRAAQLPAGRVHDILDLPCGHGRVLRYLKGAFPNAELTACDLLRDGVDYCAATFGAKPVYSDEDPSKVPLAPEAFDLIWVGSLFAHLEADRWAQFLELFYRSLRSGGLLVFTTHGRRAYDWTIRGEFDYGLAGSRNAAVLCSYEKDGFGYAEYVNESSYGHSLSKPDWVFKQIEALG